MRAVRPRIRTLLLAVAAIAVLLAWVIFPAWRYYRLPPSTRSVLAKLTWRLRVVGPAPVVLQDLLKAAVASSAGAAGTGIPVHVDPIGLEEAGATLVKPVKPTRAGITIGMALDESLGPLGLGYYVEDGVLRITSTRSAAGALRDRPETALRP